MLGLLLSLLSLVSCESDSLIQTLVFGSDQSSKTDEYFCDCNFSPYRNLVSVTIFKVINQNQDQAVPCSRVFASPSPNSRGYARIEIPNTLAVKNISYSFQFEFSDGPNAFSESWEFDSSKGQFGLCSSVQKKWWESENAKMGIAAGVLVGVLGGGYMLYKRQKKSRSLYVQ